MTGAPDEQPKGGVGAVRDAASLDALFTARLADGLRELGRSAKQDRDFAIRVIEFLAAMCGEVMDRPEGAIGSAEVVMVMHSTTQILRRVAGALRDLDHGAVDELLRRNLPGGRLYATHELDTAYSAVAFAWLLNNKKGVSASECAKRVAKAFASTETKFHGQPITGKQILSWMKSPPGHHAAPSAEAPMRNSRSPSTPSNVNACVASVALVQRRAIVRGDGWRYGCRN